MERTRGAYRLRIVLSEQWVQSCFSRWQCYWTPGGYAKSNNPAEKFNKDFKRDYTLRARMKLTATVEKLIACYQFKSTAGSTPLRHESAPTSTLKTKTRHQCDQSLLTIGQNYKTNLGYTLHGGSATGPNVVRVIQSRTPATAN